MESVNDESEQVLWKTVEGLSIEETLDRFRFGLVQIHLQREELNGLFCSEVEGR